ncbi:MAG TPA: rhodanese-related sulfurtransferase [Candidatus Paceibacterota bacterium]|nr:rhodanese-related sulfurtransferase [Candidatus Paceibacterota bacterium]
MHQIALYYKYVRIEDPEALKNAQKALLTRLGAKGRIIVAHEGINGTFEAKPEAVAEYIEIMKADPRFADIHWKISDGTEAGDAFPKLSVKVRKEIVSLHLIDGSEDINPNEITGVHLKPEELRSWYEEGKEFYIVDMRNDYELKSGKFEGTIFPGLKNFRDLRKNVNEIKNLKDKTVLTVCTGGVRCEKASGYLKREGFENVYQLDGGIVSYMAKYPGKDFKGSLYVFDKRHTMHFENPENHEIIGRCEKCEIATEKYVDCANLSCHKHFICCENCLDENGSAYCDEECKMKWEAYEQSRKQENLV